jgi:serine phosphatase RsbU (regulator of sigma subunit)/PAS domain-containing protein
MAMTPDRWPVRVEVGHLRAVHRLTAAMVAADSAEDIYQAALDVLIEALGVDRAAILLYDDDGVMRFRAWRGLSDCYRRLAEGHSPWRRDDTAAEPVVVTDVATDASLETLRGVILGEGIRALAFIPLLYGNQLLGKFMVYADEPREFDGDELALAATVAGHVAFALEKRRLEERLRLMAEELGATLNAVSEGITVQAPDGTLYLANAAAADMVGFDSVEALLAAQPAEIVARFQLLDADGSPLRPGRLPGRAALKGQHPPEMLVRWRRPLGADVALRYSLVKASPVFDEAGGVRFAVNTFRDVTDRQVAVEALRASEARLAFLAAASRRLMTTSLEPRQVLQEAAALAVPELADWCAVREFAGDGQLSRVAVAPREDPRGIQARLEHYGDMLRGDPVIDELVAGRSLLVADVTADLLRRRARDDEHLRLLEELELGSAMLVPLQARGRTIGVLTLARSLSRPAFNQADLELAEEFGARVAATVEHARSFADEHATAETLARALLPGRLPEIAGLHLAARYRAAGQVGGDFYDAFATGDNTWLLVVGDVCGRGIQAASMTGLTRHTVRAAALRAATPTAVLADLNQILFDATGELTSSWLGRTRVEEPSFCTVCLAQVTPGDGGAQVVVAVAGHPLPLVVRHDGQVEEVGRSGSLLGVLAQPDLGEVSCQLAPGDTLVLFTDGITERRHERRFFGEEQLHETLRGLAGAPVEELAQRVEQAALDFDATAPQDDMAILAIQVPPAPRP